TTLTYQTVSGKLFDFGMDWTLLDMKASETQGKVTKNYLYDSESRLRSNWSYNDSIRDIAGKPIAVTEENHEIDGHENFKNTKNLQGQSLKCVPNSRNQLTSVEFKKAMGNTTVSVNVKPTYDTNGNLTDFVHHYTYNYRNQLIRVVTGVGITVEYKYDALGRRIEKKVTAPKVIGTKTVIETKVIRYIFDGWQVIEERDGADKLIARYTYGSGIDERVRVQYLDDKGKFNTYIPLQDTIGNVIALTDEAGNVKEKYIYSTYGAPMFYCDDIPADTDNAFIMEGVITMQFTEPVKTESVNTAV
ncbi:MAG: hypothetical protein GY765_36870, partial [bacterium]|nr:hypothetical protein [bacterium]